MLCIVVIELTWRNWKRSQNKDHGLPRSTYQEDEIKQENEVFQTRVYGASIPSSTRRHFKS